MNMVMKVRFMQIFDLLWFMSKFEFIDIIIQLHQVGVFACTGLLSMAIRKCLQASLQNHLFEAPILQCLLQANSFTSNQPSSSHHMSQYIHLGLLTKPFSSSHQYRFASSDVARKLQAPDKVVLYRAKWMQPLRLMVRCLSHTTIHFQHKIINKMIIVQYVFSVVVLTTPMIGLLRI